MKLTRIITKIFYFIYFLIRFRHTKTAWLFAHYQLTLKNSQLVRAAGSDLEFVFTRNKIPLSLLPLYSLELNLLVRSLNYKSVEVTKTNTEGFIARIEGVQLWIKSVSNLFTLHEIFQSTLYGIYSTENNAVVLDIGMNVGFASLYFANLPFVSQVYSFEPFKETYHEALQNFELNSSLSGKITAYDFGISNYSRTMQVPVLESGSAVTSTNETFIKFNQSNNPSTETTEVDLKSIKDVIQETLQKHPSQPIYLKVDCEGEEYNIFEQLDELGYLSNISGILLEWHLKGPQELVDRLLKYQFTVLSLPIHSATDSDQPVAGMLYAFRHSS